MPLELKKIAVAIVKTVTEKEDTSRNIVEFRVPEEDDGRIESDRNVG